jgi:glutathione S-transferase
MRLDGAHSHGSSGGGLGLVVLVVAVIMFAKAGKSAGRAAGSAGHALSTGLRVATDIIEWTLITVAVLAAAAVTVACIWAGVHLYRRYREQIQVAARTIQAVCARCVVAYRARVAARRAAAVPPPEPRKAIEAPVVPLEAVPDDARQFDYADRDL